jgi:rRNA-processing protein FCF1
MIEVKSYIQRLQEQLRVIEHKTIELIGASTINRFYNVPDSAVIIIAPPFYWGKTDERQKRLQMEILKLYRPWIEHIRLLFNEAPNEISQEIDDIDKFVMRWVQKESSWDIPASIEEAKAVFSKKIRRFFELLEMLESSKHRKVIVVPDTNALIICPDFTVYRKVAGQSNFTMVILPTVLSELDQLKITARDQQFREKVSSVIRRIKGLRSQGSLLEGVTVDKTISVRMEAREPDFDHTLSWLDPSNNDDRLVASILELQRQEPSAVVILCTADINLQNKAEMAHISFVETPDAR